jgi:hypothetical protein
MTDWSIDMGFDKNALLSPDESGNDVAYLQWGAVNLGTNAPADLNSVRPGDTIQFNLYDVTALNDGTYQGGSATPSLAAPENWKGTWQWITVGPADSNTCGNPFGDDVLATLQGSTTSLHSAGTGPSAVFPGSSYPKWQVVTGDALARPRVTVDQRADYLYSLRLWVQWSDKTVQYEVDPEMIVVPGG